MAYASVMTDSGVESQLVYLSVCRADTKRIGQRGVRTASQYSLITKELRTAALSDRIRRK